MTGNHFLPTVMPAINEDQQVRGFKACKIDLDIFGLVAKVDLSIYNEDFINSYGIENYVLCTFKKQATDRSKGQ